MQRDVPADGETLRCGDGDSEAREAAGADSDQQLRRHVAVQHFGDQRNEAFGMAAADDLVA